VPTATTRIEDVETVIVDLPTIRPHQLSMTTMNGQTLMIIRIRMSDGIVGIGEGTTIGGLAYGPESPEGMKLAIDTYITPILLQSDPDRIGPTMGTINKAVQGNNFAKCAVETALVDALGKRNRLTASELLGGAFTIGCPSPGRSQAATLVLTLPKRRRCSPSEGTIYSS
jgi:muconate cycloisomerase